MSALETTCIGYASPKQWGCKRPKSPSAPHPPHARKMPYTTTTTPAQNSLARRVRSPRSCAGFYPSCPRVVARGWPTQDQDARPLASRPVLETKHAPEMSTDSTRRTLYDLG